MQSKCINVITLREKIFYGFGDMASNLIFQYISIFLLFFYTDIFGITAAAAGTLLLVSRIFDAINDPIIGSLVDNTRSRWGKFRPYLLYGSIPLAVFTILCFSTPQLSQSYKLLYAYITYIGLGVSYTFVNIPYSAMTAVITQDPQKRSELSSVRMVFAVIGALVVVSTAQPIVSALGRSNRQLGFLFSSIIFAFLSLLLFWLCFGMVKERVRAAEKQKIGILKIWYVLKSNTPLIIVSTAFMFDLTAYTISTSSTLYYFKYNIGNEALNTIYLLISILSMITGMLFVPMLSRRLGKRNAAVLGLIVVIISCIGIYFTPYKNITLILIWAGISGIGYALPTALSWAMVPDTVEYGEWKTGLRTEGIIYSTYSFAQKLATAIGGAAAALILELTGYIPNQVQSSTALKGILLNMTLVPAGFMILTIIIISFYRLDDNSFYEILASIDQNKAKGSM
ncbi:MAG: glycoside-pentoside-hexuronide (GPH):cation symporter [Bacillota bacterium]